MKVKTLIGALTLCTVALTASPSFAVITLTEGPLDAITAGGEFALGSFVLTVADITGAQYVDTYKVLNPGFAWGSDKIHFLPLGGPLFQSFTVTIPNNIPNYTTH